MFETLFDFIDVITVQNAGHMSGQMMGVISPLMGACVGLYAIYVAYQALFDSQNMMIMESIKFMGSLAVVCAIALSSTWYMGHVVPIVLTSGDKVAEVLNGGGSSHVSLQIMFDQIFISIEAMYDVISMGLDPDTWINAFLIWQQIFLVLIGSIIFLTINTAYLLVAKVMVSFLLIVGPLFIMCAFFPSTRDFFKAWTGQCFNYVLLTILYTVAFSIFVDVLDMTVFSMNISYQSNILTLIVFCVMALISVQIPVFCSSLSGGVGINGIVGSVAGSLGALARTVKSSKPKGSKIPKPTGNNIAAG